MKGTNNRYDWKVDVNSTGPTDKLVDDVIQGNEKICNLKTGFMLDENHRLNSDICIA
jgi:hypothetical protein